MYLLLFFVTYLTLVRSFLYRSLGFCRKPSRLANTIETIQEKQYYPFESPTQLGLKSENEAGLNNRTIPFLNTQKYPLGSLPSWAISDSLNILNGWAKTSSYTGAATATSILKRLEDEADFGNSEIELSVMHYSIVSNAWAKSNDNEAGIKAEEVLEKLIKRSKVHSSLTPNRVILNCIIHAWSKQGNIKRAEDVFARMKADPKIEVESGDYNALLAAYAREGDTRKAEQLLKAMLELKMCPDLISYNCVLDAWRHSNEPGAAERANSILNIMQRNFDSGAFEINPNAKSYSIVASAYIKSDTKESMTKINQLLSLAESRGFVEGTYLYNTVLDALAVSSKQDAPFKAEEMLDEMMKKGIANTISYNTVLKAWQLSNRKEAAIRSKAILDCMERLNADNKIDVSPDPFSYAAVIQCYIKSGEISKAVSLFHKMLDNCRAGRSNLKPNTTTLNVVLNALAKYSDKKSSEEAYKLLCMFRDPGDSCMENVKLSSISYTSVIDAFAKNCNLDAAQKAEEVFELMEAEFRRGNLQAKPNTRSFNTLMNAWVQTGQKENVVHAEQLLKRMESEYESGNHDVRPSVYSYSILMHGWSKFPGSLGNTTGVFNRMVKAYNNGNKEAKPNSHSFGSLIYATAKSGRSEAPIEAERLLKTLHKHYRRGDEAAKPNTQTFTTVINSWAKAGRPDSGERAQALLEWMIDLYEEENDVSFKPNEVSWNLVISAWAKSRVFSKAIQAQQLLQRMIKRYNADNKEAKPNTHVYTAVINAAAYTTGEPEEKKHAFKIADHVFNSLDKSAYGEPNHITYSTYFSACQHLIPEENIRFTAIQSRFQKCCEEGMVSSLVLQKVKAALSDKQLKALLKDHVSSDGLIMVKKLPMSKWGRKVKENKKQL